VYRRWLAVPAGVGFGDGEADGFELGDQFAEPPVVVEPGSVVGELVVGQDAGGWGKVPFARWKEGAPRGIADSVGRYTGACNRCWLHAVVVMSRRR